MLWIREMLQVGIIIIIIIIIIISIFGGGVGGGGCNGIILQIM